MPDLTCPACGAKSGDGLAQAIPPAYTEFIGAHLIEALEAVA